MLTVTPQVGLFMSKAGVRSFLPGNVKCRRLYMTFTYDHLLKFFELRCHPAAQAEIRSFAMSAQKGFEIETEKFKVEPDKNTGVDEIISDKEVIMEKIIFILGQFLDWLAFLPFNRIFCFAL